MNSITRKQALDIADQILADAERERLEAAEREAERNQLIMIAARWEAICDILAGVEPSDFMLSFGEVRQVLDLWNNAKTETGGKEDGMVENS